MAEVKWRHASKVRLWKMQVKSTALHANGAEEGLTAVQESDKQVRTQKRQV